MFEAKGPSRRCGRLVRMNVEAVPGPPQARLDASRPLRSGDGLVGGKPGRAWSLAPPGRRYRAWSAGPRRPCGHDAPEPSPEALPLDRPAEGVASAVTSRSIPTSSSS